MRVFAYAFKAGKWVETPRLSVRDVALLVDTEGRTIYIWHGPKSKIKDQNEAKKLLLSLRDRYSSFQFQKVERNPAPELQAEIKRLLGSPLGQGKTRIFAYAGIFLGFAAVGMAVYLLYTLYDVTAEKLVDATPVACIWPQLGSASGCTFQDNYLQSITWFTIIGMILFGLALLFSGLAGRKYMAVTLLVGLIMGIITILYISYGRPTAWSQPGILSLFQTL
ncbi:MAG: hypothetical protein ACTSRA_10345, partial [Promethearchaeota archaeon]